MAGRTIHMDRLPVKCDRGVVLKLVEAEKSRPRFLEELFAALDVIVMAVGVGHVAQFQAVPAHEFQDLLPGSPVDGHGLGPAEDEVPQVVVPVSELFDVQGHVSAPLSRAAARR